MAAAPAASGNAGQLVQKFLVHGMMGLAVGLGICGLTTVNSDVDQRYPDRSSLEILKQYSMELFDTFIALSALREKNPQSFAVMQKGLVRLLTIELYFEKVALKRTDWPRVASSYAYDVQQSCAALAEFVRPSGATKKQLDCIVKVAKDAAHNIDVEASRMYLYGDH